MKNTERYKQAIKKRKEHERKLRIEGILDAAKTVFLKKGYHDARMEDIALHAGLSKPTLYRYFENKAHLFFSLIEPCTDTIQNEISCMVTQIKKGKYETGRDFIRAYFEALQRVYQQSQESFRILNLISESGEYRKLSGNYRSILTKKIENNVSAGREMFKMVIKQGLIKKYHNETITNMMYGFFIGPIQSFYMASQIDNKLTNRKNNDDKVATLINMIIDTISDALSAK